MKKRYWLASAASILLILGISQCGSQPKYENRRTTTPGTCEEGSVKSDQCPDGGSGGIVTQCTDGAWKEISNTCEGNNPPPTGCDKFTFDRLKPVITNNCISCHPGYDVFTTARTKINGYIGRINLPVTDLRHMPKDRNDLSGADKQKFQDWLKDGLLENCNTQAYNFLNFNYVEDYILQDITRIDPFSRGNIRYLVMSHVTNQTKDIAPFLQGSNKAINSLSLERRLQALTAVDPQNTIFRVDLEAYDLNAKDWNLLEDTEKINIESFTSKGLLIKFLAQTRKPWLHAENFNFTSHQTDTYYELLKLPKTFNEFVQLDFIDLNFNDIINRLEIQLLGFNGSPISLNKNRLLSRIQTEEGYLWTSYDVFDVDDRTRNLFEFPLLEGLGGQNNFAFQASELIFSLPNGLQGYILFNAAGIRQDFAPVDLVFDNESSFDPQIDNGLDCHRCHAGGLIPATDQIRSHVLQNAGQFDVNDVALVQSLFVREAATLFEFDNSSFRKTLSSLGIDDPDTDPINVTTDFFRSDYNLAKAAGIVFFTPDQLKTCISISGVLSAQIGQLLTGGTVSFDQFTTTLPQLIKDCGVGQEVYYP